jgi:hypothetical protein
VPQRPPDPTQSTNEEKGLDSDQEAGIVSFIRERFGSQNYVTKRDALNYVEERFNKMLTYRWMKHFLDRQKKEVRLEVRVVISKNT